MSNHPSINQVGVLTLGLAIALLAPKGASAQPPAAGPDEAACQGKQAGDACSLVNGSAGTCGPGTCSRLDYSQGSPPKATEEPCTVCSVGAASSTGGPPALGTTHETRDTGESAATSKDPSTGEAPSSEVDDPPKTSSRCSVMDRSTPNDLGWLGLLGLLGTVVVGRQRKRNLR